MNSRQLNIFLLVTKYKSFNKASNYLYITPSTVMNQINLLENELGGVQLFTRKSTGLDITEAGRVFSRDATIILHSIEEAKSKLKNFQQKYKVIIANSPQIPATKFNDLWEYLAKNLPNYQFIYSESNDRISTLYNHIGQDYDILIGPETNQPNQTKIKVAYSNFDLLMLPSNPLSNKDVVNIDDLTGQSIFMNPYSPDKGLKEIKRSLLQVGVKIKASGTFYAKPTFYKIKRSNESLLITDFFENIRPGLVKVPINSSAKLSIYSITSAYAPNYIKYLYKVIKHWANYNISKKDGRR